jgi:hypothetical protein
MKAMKKKVSKRVTDRATTDNIIAVREGLIICSNLLSMMEESCKGQVRKVYMKKAKEFTVAALGQTLCAITREAK